MHGIRAVVFDLDGTLLDRRRSFEQFVRAQWLRFADRLRPLDVEQYVRAAIERDGDGYLARNLLFTSVLAPFGFPESLAGELLRDFRAEFPAACVLFPDALSTLAALRGAGFSLGLITNGSVRMQTAKMHHLRLTPLFDVALISDAEGLHKPDPRIFHRALERLGAEPAHAVFVGNHPQVDVAGARAAGMKGVWRRDPAFPVAVEADAVIEELRDILALVGVSAQAGHAGD